jgi:hypothetical protein
MATIQVSKLNVGDCFKFVSSDTIYRVDVIRENPKIAKLTGQSGSKYLQSLSYSSSNYEDLQNRVRTVSKAEIKQFLKAERIEFDRIQQMRIDRGMQPTSFS